MLEINRIRWALRKIKLPVGNRDLVLDVGAGGNPYPRSDVLMDRLTGAEHRCGESMLIDRPVLFGDASKMPFKDKAFDFVIASHILEHMADPGTFLLELQRVGKAGYIEVPNALFERLHPYNIHCLEILEKEECLYIYKKARPVEDPFLGTMELLSEKSPWGRLMFRSPQMFHVRFFWSHNICYEIVNPNVSTDWIEEINNNSCAGDIKDSYLADDKGWREIGLSVLNRWNRYKRSKRLKNFSLEDILACPECKSGLEADKSVLHCRNCNLSYKYTNGLPDFTSPETGGCRV